MKHKIIPIFIIYIVSLLLFVCVCSQAPAEEKVSKPGVYSGYSTVLYDGDIRFSQYVTVRDGTKLAVDIYRPTLNGQLVETPLPVIWMHTPYNRRYYPASQTKHLSVDLYPGAARGLIKYGYVVAVVDQRGLYASYGTTYSLDGWDAYDITEWFAAQSWSNGKVGMWGCSATGGSQIAAANLMPPSLKAIFPMSNGFSPVRGVSLPPAVPPYPTAQDLPGDIPANDQYAVRVDEDGDGAMLAAAKEQHKYNYLVSQIFITPDGTELPRVQRLPVSLDQLEQSKVAMYNGVNWDDLLGLPLGTILRFSNLNNPSKLIIGPADHCIWCTQYSPKPYPKNFMIATEELRWFDYWLKGIKNGVNEEPPIYYFTQNAVQGVTDWRFSWRWPVPNAKAVKFYLREGSSGLGYGVNDGKLSTVAPNDANARDIYTTDYDIPLETPYVGAVTWITEPLQSTRGLTYTSEPFTADTELTGHPVVHLWVSSTATDGDFWVDIEDIDEMGSAKTIIPASGSPSTVIAAGQPLPAGLNAFRASNRTINAPTFNNLGLPYHRMASEDVKPLIPGVPALILFDLRPISYIVKAGHRIRVSITCVVGQATPRLSPAPVVTFYRNRILKSFISLPVIAPVEAHVKIEPEVINPKSKGVFTAFVTFPKSLDKEYVKDLKTESVTCNGVSPLSAKFHHGAWMFKFDRRAFSGLTQWHKAEILCEGQFGNKYSYGDMTFKGSDTVWIQKQKDIIDEEKVKGG